MVDPSLIVLFRAQDDGLSAQLGKIKDGFAKLTHESRAVQTQNTSLIAKFKETANSITGLNQALEIGTKAWNLFKKAAANALDVLTDWSAASAVQERSLVQLSAALEATGKSAHVTTEALAAIAAELQRTTKFGDEASIEAMKWFAQMPTLEASEQAMRSYMMTAQDLAEVMGTELQTAVQVLARAMEDPRRASRALRRANIMMSTSTRQLFADLDDLGMGYKAIQVIQDQVAGSVGGAAKAMASTLEGTREQIRGITADLQEHGGKVINEFITPVTEGLKNVLEAWSSLFTEIDANKDGITELTEAGYAFKASMEAVNAELIAMVKNLAETETMWEAGMIDALTKAIPLGYEAKVLFGELAKIGAPLAEQAQRGLELENKLRRSNAELARKQGQENEERLRKEVAVEKEKQDRIKEWREEYEKYLKDEEAWIERMAKKSRSAAEQAIVDLERLNTLKELGRTTDKEDLAIREKIADTYLKATGSAEAIEDSNKRIKKSEDEMLRAREKIKSIDKRLDRANAKEDFTATVTSTTGLYERMLAGANQRKEEDPMLKELKEQKAEQEKMFREAQRKRDEQIKRQDRLIDLAESEERDTRSKFGL